MQAIKANLEINPKICLSPSHLSRDHLIFLYLGISQESI